MKQEPAIKSWTTGRVLRYREHFRLLYGSANDSDFKKCLLVALVGPPVSGIVTVQFVANANDPRSADAVSAASKEIDYYLIELGEADPWNYAKYHCSTSSNLYSNIHWSYRKPAEPAPRQKDRVRAPQQLRPPRRDPVQGSLPFPQSRSGALTEHRRSESEMPVTDIKPLLARPEPSWLMDVRPEDDFPVHLALTDSLYYPACGLDGDPIRHLAGYIHSFVYADYAVPEETISASLGDAKHGLKGYRLLFKKNVSKTVFPKNWRLVSDLPKGVRSAAARACQQPLGYALWAVLERMEEFGSEHGPRRLSFLFIGGEASEVFKVLYLDNGIIPDVVAIIHCGIGRGHVCTDLACRDRPLAANVLDLCERQPQFVLYGVRANVCHRCCWPEFTRKVARWREHDGELGLWWKPNGDQRYPSALVEKAPTRSESRKLRDKAATAPLQPRS